MIVALFAIALLAVGAKIVAYLWSMVALCAHGGTWADETRTDDKHPLKVNAPAHLNPLDRGLQRLTGDEPTPAGRLLLTLYTTPVLISGACVLQFLCDPDRHATLTLASGAAIALCAVIALLCAVVRRLALGTQDSDTSDVQLPDFLSGWAVAREPGANNSVYFLVLVYLSLMGFAALYVALGADSSSFGPETQEATPWTWIYFSVTTLATVGYGDIHPVSDVARATVACQIATGPLLLSWLLSVLLTTRGDEDLPNPQRAKGSSSGVLTVVGGERYSQKVAPRAQRERDSEPAPAAGRQSADGNDAATVANDDLTGGMDAAGPGNSSQHGEPGPGASPIDPK